MKQKAYAAAGVDIDLGNKVKATLPQLLASTHRREVMGITQVLAFDSVVRLPLSVFVSNLDQISVTHRMGRPLPTPLRFKITRLDDGMYQRTLYLARVGQGGQQ